MVSSQVYIKNQHVCLQKGNSSQSLDINTSHLSTTKYSNFPQEFNKMKEQGIRGENLLNYIKN